MRASHDGVVRIVEHAPIRECGQIPRHGIVESQFPFLVEHERGQARDRSSHGVQTEDRIGRHGAPGRDVSLTDRLEVDQPAVPHDPGHFTGDVTGVDVAL